MSKYRGSGGARPEQHVQGQIRGPLYTLQEEVGDVVKKVTPFMIRSGVEDTPVVTLDAGDFDFAVMLHARFNANNSWGNYLVCTKRSDPRGCPVCPVLEKPSSWYICGTVLDGSTWTIPDGKNRGKVITNQRRLLLITSSQIDEMETIGRKIGGWRGACFDVSRSTDQKSPRIGSTWFFNAKLDEDQILERYEETAADFGLPVEQYAAPLDYDSILKPRTYEELLEIAGVIKKEQEPDALQASSVGGSNEDIPF